MVGEVGKAKRPHNKKSLTHFKTMPQAAGKNYVYNDQLPCKPTRGKIGAVVP